MSTNSNSGESDGESGSGAPDVVVTGVQEKINEDSVERLFSELEARTQAEREDDPDAENLDAPDDQAAGDGAPPPASDRAGDAQPNPSELFRHEAAISQMDLRLEVAYRVEQYIKEDEHIALSEKLVHSWGDLYFVCGSRSLTVEGDYVRDCSDTDLFITSHDVFNEEVHGGVSVEFGLESEAIMGGGYLGTVLGPFMRICGWSDFMAWGGWAEADVARIEVGNVMIHSSWNFVHTAGVRALAAYNFFDDYTMRVENFGTLTDNQVTIVHAGMPGSGVASDM